MSLPFLDMLIKRNKAFVRVVDPTDTGLTMNYNAMNYNVLAPTKYKKSVVSGLVHRLHQACSSWFSRQSGKDKEHAWKQSVLNAVLQINNI